MKNLLSVQVETNHYNHDGTAWYGYFKQTPSQTDLTEAHQAAKNHVYDEAPLGIDDDTEPEEVPNTFSDSIRVKRWLIGFTC